MSRRLMSLAGLLVLAALALVVPSCNQAIMTAPPNSTITLTANPQSIPAYGGVSVISAFVMRQNGTLAPDGTVVQFFTTLGHIDAQGKTNDGIALVNLVSDSRSGEAAITAYSGGTAATTASPSASPGTGGSAGSANSATSITVKIGAVNAKFIVLTANPPRIMSPGRTSQIVATVYDGAGNPLPNVVVTFAVDELGTSQPAVPAYREWMTSEGNPVFTDNNGRAYDQLNTNRPEALGQRNVMVTATVPVVGTGTAPVTQIVQVQIY